MNKEERKNNLILIKALELVDIEKAKLFFESEEISINISSNLIQDSLMLPEGHNLKLSNELMLKGLNSLLLKEIEKVIKLNATEVVYVANDSCAVDVL